MKRAHHSVRYNLAMLVMLVRSGFGSNEGQRGQLKFSLCVFTPRDGAETSTLDLDLDLDLTVNPLNL